MPFSGSLVSLSCGLWAGEDSRRAKSGAGLMSMESVVFPPVKGEISQDNNSDDDSTIPIEAKSFERSNAKVDGDDDNSPSLAVTLGHSLSANMILGTDVRQIYSRSTPGRNLAFTVGNNTLECGPQLDINDDGENMNALEKGVEGCIANVHLIRRNVTILAMKLHVQRLQQEIRMVQKRVKKYEQYMSDSVLKASYTRKTRFYAKMRALAMTELNNLRSRLQKKMTQMERKSKKNALTGTVAAFVTFENEESYRRCIEDYAPYSNPTAINAHSICGVNGERDAAFGTVASVADRWTGSANWLAWLTNYKLVLTAISRHFFQPKPLQLEVLKLSNSLSNSNEKLQENIISYKSVQHKPKMRKKQYYCIEVVLAMPPDDVIFHELPDALASLFCDPGAVARNLIRWIIVAMIVFVLIWGNHILSTKAHTEGISFQSNLTFPFDDICEQTIPRVWKAPPKALIVRDHTKDKQCTESYRTRNEEAHVYHWFNIKGSNVVRESLRSSLLGHCYARQHCLSDSLLLKQKMTYEKCKDWADGGSWKAIKNDNTNRRTFSNNSSVCYNLDNYTGPYHDPIPLHCFSQCIPFVNSQNMQEMRTCTGRDGEAFEINAIA